jgi:hypothetical protein
VARTASDVAGLCNTAANHLWTTVSSSVGRIRGLKRKKLENASCECYEVIRAHFQRLGL